jgi:hypothetical protein
MKSIGTSIYLLTRRPSGGSAGYDQAPNPLRRDLAETIAARSSTSPAAPEPSAIFELPQEQTTLPYKRDDGTDPIIERIHAWTA